MLLTGLERLDIARHDADPQVTPVNQLLGVDLVAVEVGDAPVQVVRQLRNDGVGGEGARDDAVV